jgi:hypothetical protein
MPSRPAVSAAKYQRAEGACRMDQGEWHFESLLMGELVQKSKGVFLALISVITFFGTVSSNTRLMKSGFSPHRGIEPALASYFRIV